jgi:spore coat polysaccharide biosynthesis predicted glycosyltransferase SpsG
MHDKHYVADIVINHAEGIDPLVYSIESYTKLLIGYKYALLRKEIRNGANNFTKKKYSALVVMGGADPLRITPILVEQLAKYHFSKPVAVVVGGDEIKTTKISRSENIIYFQKLNAGEMAELMLSAEFGIFPASTVSVEACRIGLPFICGYYVDNQIEIYRGIEENKLAVCIGDYTTFSTEKMDMAISEITSQEILLSILEKQTIAMDNQTENRFKNIFKEL